MLVRGFVFPTSNKGRTHDHKKLIKIKEGIIADKEAIETAGAFYLRNKFILLIFNERNYVKLKRAVSGTN